MRDQAVNLVRGCEPIDDRCRMRTILAWVKTIMPFERDVLETETLHDPLDTLERVKVYGGAAGDCDDACLLLAALLESIGIRTKMKAISTRRDKRLHHVVVEAFDRGSGTWFHLDVYGRQEAGRPLVRFTAADRVSV